MAVQRASKSVKKLSEASSLAFDEVFTDRPNINKKERNSTRRLLFSGLPQTTAKTPTDLEYKAPQLRGPTRVFLYFHLEKINDMPASEHKLRLNLNHKDSSVIALHDHYTPDKHFDIDDLEFISPTFVVTIERDNIEHTNRFTDCPVTIRINEHHTKYNEESDTYEEFDVPIAEGSIDLLEFFSTRRNANIVNTFLYPIGKSAFPTAFKTKWRIYTLLPLIKDLSFCNIVFITFESIYNATPEIINNANDLTVRLSFQSKTPNDNNEFDTINICSFHSFTEKIIGYQNCNIIWESMKQKGINNRNCLSVQTGALISMHKIFKDLLCPEKVYFQFNEININRDSALICNSVHRLVLTVEFMAVLQEICACNQQHILLEVYESEKPEEILMTGTFDLSIFLYPNSNSCRFAVQLDTVKQPLPTISGNVKNPAKPDPSKSKTSVRSSKLTGPNTIVVEKPKLTFAIIHICFLNPITDPAETISDFNENPLRKDTLKRCRAAKVHVEPLTAVQLCEKSYSNFEQLIVKIIGFIEKNDITSLNADESYFCCQLRNLEEHIIALIACDFNIRTPTKTNLEFMNLLTTVYKELELRMHNLLKNGYDNNLKPLNDPEMQLQIINLMTSIKYLYEAGFEDLAQFLFDKLKENNEQNVCLSFYIYLYDVERQNFEAAKEYQDKPLAKRFLDGEYFIELIRLYIKYMENLEHEEDYNEALENLIINLNHFIEKNPLEKDSWILLYCLYKNCNYLPGESFTRFKYENSYENERTELPAIPKSRWEIYNDYKFDFKTPKAIHFADVIKRFERLGLYKFAEIVYLQIEDECTDAEKHFMTTTFKIFKNEVDPIIETNQKSSKNQKNQKSAPKTARSDPGGNAANTNAFQYFINGNYDYFCGATMAAMQNYRQILLIKDLNDFNDFQLALLRYANHCLEAHEYEHVIEVFEKCCSLSQNKLVAYFGIGKAMYRLNRLKEAEMYFAKATDCRIFVPDIWAYLALVNLKMGNNFKALESWKHARHNHCYNISDEILEELNKINPSDVFLYVDKPMNAKPSPIKKC